MFYSLMRLASVQLDNLLGACRASEKLWKIIAVGDREQEAPFLQPKTITLDVQCLSFMCGPSSGFDMRRFAVQYRMPQQYGVANSQRVYRWRVDGTRMDGPNILRVDPGEASRIGTSWINGEEAKWAAERYYSFDSGTKAIIC